MASIWADEFDRSHKLIGQQVTCLVAIVGIESAGGVGENRNHRRFQFDLRKFLPQRRAGVGHKPAVERRRDRQAMRSEPLSG